jgi:hypothetical protein
MGRPKKLLETPPDLKNLVTVAFAEDMELAEQHKRQLLENSIPAAIEPLSDQKKMPMAEVAVMVPEEFLEQAYTFLARQAAVMISSIWSLARMARPVSSGMMKTNTF